MTKKPTPAQFDLAARVARYAAKADKRIGDPEGSAVLARAAEILEAKAMAARVLAEFTVRKGGRA